MRLLMPNGNPINAPERIPEFSEVQPHETERALTIERREQQAFLSAGSARAHEDALAPSTLV